MLNRGFRNELLVATAIKINKKNENKIFTENNDFVKVISIIKIYFNTNKDPDSCSIQSYQYFLCSAKRISFLPKKFAQQK